MKKHWPTLVFLLLVALLGSGLYHWVKVSNAREFNLRTDNALILWTASDPDFLNPILRTATSSWEVVALTHHELLEEDNATGELRPLLVKDWGNSEDGKDYIFHLRTDIRWHDGERFDAEDVVFSFKTCMDPEIPGYSRNNFIDCWITDSAPLDNRDGQIEASEYLEIDLGKLPTMTTEPLMDGVPDSAAEVIATGSSCRLSAARYGDLLYLCGTIQPRHDSVIFLSRQPGEQTLYGPSSQIAQWDAFFIADSGNTYPAQTGWLAKSDVDVDNATYALGAQDVECVVNLKDFYAGQVAQSTQSLFVLLCIVDDVQVDKIDDFTVKYHFPRVNYNNLRAAGFLRTVAEHYYNDPDVSFMEHPRRNDLMGVGPYRLVKWERNDYILLERWKEYWGEKPKIEKIRFKIINDSVVAYQVFRNGDIDAMSIGDAWKFLNQNKDPEFNKHFYAVTYYKPGYLYTAWNHEISFFKEKKVRQAMAHLVDIKEAANHVYMGLAQPITGPFFPGEPAYNHDVPVIEYDIERAKQLLDESGWIDSDGDGIRDKDLNGDGVISHESLDKQDKQRERFSFSFLRYGDVQNDWRALSMLNNCKKVGIDCTIRHVEFALFLERVKTHKYDASSSGWGLGFESDPYFWFHSSQAKDGFNREQFRNPEVDALLDEAREELDFEKRTILFRKVHRRIWEEQPYTFLLSLQQNWVVNKRVKNVKPYPLGLDKREWSLAGHE
jgi:peptide/nickel transport system substrate-binding protein